MIAHRSLVLCLATVSAAVSTAAAGAEYQISGPYAHDNATLFLVHPASPPPAAVRPATTSARKYLPLKEALAQKKIVVHETGNVNQLAIENVSADSDVFIQSGDIVKGGQQDRVFSTDLILPPKSGKTPIESFCVEQGRWSKRGSEDARRFSGSANLIVSKDAKLAIKGNKNQGEVWQSVAKVQEKLARSLGSGARMMAPAASPTSLQLALEDQRVVQGADRATAAFRSAAASKPGAIGFVFAVNGQIQSAEIYSSPELFRDLWPKQSEALAIEAVAERRPAGAAPAVLTAAGAQRFLDEADKSARPGTESPNRRTKVVKKDTAKALLVESHDEASRAWVHRSYVAK